MATCRLSAELEARLVLLEGVLDLLAGLFEVAHRLVVLAFTFHLFVVRGFAKVLLGCALDLILLVLQLVVPAHHRAPFLCTSPKTRLAFDVSCLPARAISVQ